MRFLGFISLCLALSFVSLSASAKPTGTTTTKRKTPTPSSEQKNESAASEAKTDPAPPPAPPPSESAPSPTTTTSASIDEPDPSARAREKAEKETARQKAEAEARSGFQVAPIAAFGLHSTQLRQGALGLGGNSESIGAMGFGGGLRAGYVLVRGMYVGGTFIYHTGESRNVAAGKIEGGLWYGGIELGHQVAAGPVLIRPYAGLGYADVTLKAPINNQPVDASGGKVALWPGVTAVLPITASIFAAADARYVAVFGVDNLASASGFTFGLSGGAKF